MRPDRTWNAATAATCGWLAMLILAMLMIEFDPRLDAIGGGRTIELLRNAGLSKARAETAPGASCAAADLRLVSTIETHGEAQDISGEILYAAFSTMMHARAACDAGRIDEALALYDNLTLSLSKEKRQND